jgi:hypothetical protein
MAEIPSHWYGVGHAPRFSRCVARASQAVHDAEAALLAALEQGYPHGAAVYVIHSRGCFTGTVHSWDTYGCRVLVKNDRTQKVAKWWAAQVQLIEETPDGADGVKGGEGQQ